MSKKKLTPWFPSNTTPARAGFYDTRFSKLQGHVFRRYWNGQEWTSSADTGALIFQDRQWRGLAEKP